MSPITAPMIPLTISYQLEVSLVYLQLIDFVTSYFYVLLDDSEFAPIPHILQCSYEVFSKVFQISADCLAWHPLC